jgi:hypothetical protein
VADRRPVKGAIVTPTVLERGVVPKRPSSLAGHSRCSAGVASRRTPNKHTTSPSASPTRSRRNGSKRSELSPAPFGSATFVARQVSGERRVHPSKQKPAAFRRPAPRPMDSRGSARRDEPRSGTKAQAAAHSHGPLTGAPPRPRQSGRSQLGTDPGSARCGACFPFVRESRLGCSGGESASRTRCTARPAAPAGSRR